MAEERMPRCFGVSKRKPIPKQCDHCRVYPQCAKELRKEIERLEAESMHLADLTEGLCESLGGSVTWNGNRGRGE